MTSDARASARPRLRLRKKRSHAHDGEMTLLEHLRELRNRLAKAALGILVGTVVAWFYYDPIFEALRAPFDRYRDTALDRGLTPPQLALRGVTDAFFLRIKVSLAAGIILSCPIWLYQLWAFVTPGLHRNEKRWSFLFLATAVPLFLGGVGLCYLVLPKGIEILLGFTPEGVANLPDVPTYLNFVIRMALVFGVGFELPLFLVMLTAAQVLTWETLRGWSRPLIFGVFVFAAVATPTGDPVTMLFLAVPVLVLLGLAMLVCRLIDGRRNRRLQTTVGLDEPSALDLRPSDIGGEARRDHLGSDRR